MTKLEFFHIDEGYITFLHTIDNRVQLNKCEHRPYIGIVLQINGVNYYAPLESPKPSHQKMKNGGPVMKIDEGKLGLIGFNNMVPVSSRYLLSFDINEIEDEQYRNLLRKQLTYCRKYKNVIYTRADNTYKKAVSGDVPFYRKVCCDFKKLEASYMLYKKKRKTTD